MDFPSIRLSRSSAPFTQGPRGKGLVEAARSYQEAD